MRNRNSCTQNHHGTVPAEQLKQLPESQAGAWRHRCAACAYELGYEDGLRAAMRRLRGASLRAVQDYKEAKT